MVEQALNLDTVFHALADQTRRDILKRVSQSMLSISKLAEPYKMSFAAIAKHISVLERAKLVYKERKGKQQIICAVPKTVKAATLHLQVYEQMWHDRFDALDSLLKTNP